MTAPRRSSPRAVTFTSNAIAVANSIKTTIATATANINYTGATLNGASTTPYPDSKTGYAQWPTATASSATGAFTLNSVIRFTSTYKGAAVIRNLTVASADGNATWIADGPVDGPVTNIYVPAQATTGGTWTFGFADLECRNRTGLQKDACPWEECRGSTAANIGYVDLEGVAQILPCIAGEHHMVQIYRLKTSTTTTALVTLYE